MGKQPLDLHGAITPTLLPSRDDDGGDITLKAFFERCIDHPDVLGHSYWEVGESDSYDLLLDTQPIDCS